MHGGLGNQLFQYAAGRSLADKLNTALVVVADMDGTPQSRESPRRPFALPLFGRARYTHSPAFPDYAYLSDRESNYVRYKIGKIIGSKYVCRNKKHPAYEASVHRRPIGTCLQGHYQEHRYFSDNSKKIRDYLSFTTPLTGANMELARQIRQDCNAVSLHFRRGDYLKPPFDRHMEKVSMSYYQRATNHIADKTGGTLKLYVFSDDIEWVRRNCRFDWPTQFVGINDGSNPYYDLYLQSLCAHNIIANSTMSWWGGGG